MQSASGILLLLLSLFSLLSLLVSSLAVPALPLFSRVLSGASLLPPVPSPHANTTRHPLIQRDWAHGWCGIHLHQVFGDEHGNVSGTPRAGTLSGYMLDAWHYPIGRLEPVHFNYDSANGTAEKDTFELDSQLKDVMVLKLHGDGKAGEWNREPKLWVRFALGGDVWESADGARCRVGKTDAVRVWSWFYFVDSRVEVAWTRDMDCGFMC